MKHLALNFIYLSLPDWEFIPSQKGQSPGSDFYFGDGYTLGSSTLVVSKVFRETNIFYSMIRTFARNSRWQVFFKIEVLKNLVVFTGIGVSF